MQTKPRIGIVSVSYGHEQHMIKIASQIKKQIEAGDIFVVVDNKPGGGLKKQLQKSCVDSVIELDNPGFAAGVNKGVDSLINKVDMVFILNPDTRLSTNTLKNLRAEYKNETAAWMPLLLLSDGRVNSAGNIIHISGLSWCDGFEGNPEDYKQRKEISELSGACMVFRVEWWKRVGGLSERYFLYYEDPDLCARLKLIGGDMVLVPNAKVYHEYEFDKGKHKWFYLERNRLIYITRTWPFAVILVLLPLLLGVEAGLWILAVLDRRLKLKIRSTLSFLESLPLLLQDRKEIQSTRVVSSYHFLRSFQWRLDPYAYKSLDQPILQFLLRTYYNLALFVLSLFSRKIAS